MSRRAAGRIAAAALLLGAAAPAFAHGDVDERIVEITQQLDAKPSPQDEPDLLVRRGRLLLDAGHNQDAKGDLVRALRLDPARYEARFYIAQAQLRMRQYEAALRSVEGFLAAADSEAARSRGLNLEGDVLFAANQPFRAGDAYVAGIDLEQEIAPDHVVEAANAYHAAGRGQRALDVLDEGIARLGPLTVLEERAIAIDRDLRRYDEALARVERLVAVGQRLPWLLHDKADLLASLGRAAEAREADRAALAEIERMPAARQSTEALQTLRGSIEQALAAGDASASGGAVARR